MSTVHSHATTVPRPMLAMAAALVGVSLAAATAVRLGWAEREASPAAERAANAVTAVQVRPLRFFDALNGAVVVRDAGSGALVATIAGEQEGGGFVRGVMRGLARERRMHGIGAEPVFVLTAWSDGGLSLTDTATGRVIELGAFGPDNRKTFARFLAGGRA